MEVEVRLFRYYCLRMVQSESTTYIYYSTHNSTTYHGEEEKSLEIDSECVPIIQLLQECYPRYTAIQNLPLNDDCKKLSIISDLWECGLIATRDYLPSAFE